MVTFGSYGDLHPYLAMGRALHRRGDFVTVATHPQYRGQVEAQGLGFVGLPPGPDEMPMDEEWARRSNAPVRGIEFVVKEMLLPYFAEAEARFAAAAVGHDLIITHFLAFFAPAVAESLGIPWLSVAYSPTVLFSAHDPPALGVLPFLPKLKFAGPRLINWLYRGLALPSRHWFEAIHRQRRRLRLAPLESHPLFQYHSPHGTLALFPPAFARPQPDWPVRTRQLDFPLFVEDVDRALTPAVRDFVRAGDPPLVFTLGTAVSLMRTDFFTVAERVVRASNRRAIFVVGPRPPAALERLASDRRVSITRYENFSKLFAAAAVVIHPAGTNTTALALAAGRPQVCVPFANDQLDNAQRVEALGAGVAVPARTLDTARLRRAVERAPAVLAASGFRLPPADFDRPFVAAVDDLLALARP